MKKLLIALALFFPSLSLAAVAASWQATSTTQGWIMPSRINGTEQIVVAPNFIATSTVKSLFPYASTTGLTVSGLASTSALRIDHLGDGCLNIASGLVGSQTCGSNGTVTSITAGTGLNGGAITTSGTISLISYIATSSQETAGQVPYWTSTNGTPAKLGSIATTTISNGAGITFTGTPGTLIGGQNFTISIVNGGISLTQVATSTLSSNQLLWFNSATGLIEGTSTKITVGSITATSSVTNVFPYASTTAISVSGALMVNNASSSICSE